MAALAVAAMIAAPAQAASGPMRAVVLQNAAGVAYASGDKPVTLVDKGAGSVSATFLGTTYACASASASGTFHSSTTSVPDPYLTLTTVNINGCAGPAGTTINVRLKSTAGCSLRVYANKPSPLPTVDDLLIDTVLGQLNTNHPVTGAPCLVADGGALCQMDVGGVTGGDFLEATQQLRVSGPGLSISNATGLCAFVNGAAITLNVLFKVTPGSTVGDKINFIP
ncbi:hypothetical protein KVF89_28440 [Nocardioides carbamazepini]|uniref:hypothetical protein n=1 Tax=Nocardioides carbamazepini TaxID=2854259 RepID=UPI00214A53D5|nr:hypothetical protein [Nocardioides carbamazepini]MCR1786497.1 hypothetical protein [Nocardioides carbamazepini]